MYHLRLAGNHYAMGSKLGGIFQKVGIVFPLFLDEFQIDFGIKSGKLLREYFPEAADEINGVTDVIGVDNELFTAWMMCMGCCLYNMNEQKLREVRGCTAFALRCGNNTYYGRNNDLPPFLEKGCKSIWYRPEGGNSFILNTSSFINGEEGLNEHGLVVAMTFVMPHLNEIKPGFNSIFIVRYLLEKCASTDEALIALRNLPIASSCNILLADKTGTMLVAECTADTVHIRHPETNNRGESFVITVNNFMSKQMKPHDNSDGNLYQAQERYTTVEKALRQYSFQQSSENPVDYMMEILSGKHGFMCQYNKKENFKTVWSSVFDVTSGRIYRAEGSPNRKRFTEDVRTKSRK